MQTKNQKNLCCIIFPGTQNKEFLTLFDNIKSTYNLEVLTHTADQKFEDKVGYENRIIVLYGDNDDEYKKLLNVWDMNKDRWSDRTIILAAPFDASRYKSQFNCQHVLDVSDMSVAKRDLTRIFDLCCKPSAQRLGGEKERPEVSTGGVRSGQGISPDVK